MYFDDHELRILKPGDRNPIPGPRLKFVSTTLLKMVQRPEENLLRFKGKSYPDIERDNPWLYLRFDTHITSANGVEFKKHILSEFDYEEEPTVAESMPPGSNPSGNCRAIVKFLFADTDLLDPAVPEIHSSTQNAELCGFEAPIGIFWGILGLRMLNQWKHLPRFVNENEFCYVDGKDWNLTDGS